MEEHPVLYISRILPSYRVPILEAFNRKLSGRLVTAHSKAPSDSSLQTLETSGSTFPRITLPNWLWTEKILLQPFGKIWRLRPEPSVIIAEESPRTVNLPILIRSANRRNIPVLLWGHFSSNRRRFDPDKNLMDRYRLRLARKADGVICYTSEISEMLVPYIPAERRFVATNTLDTNRLFSLFEELETEGRNAVRKRLDIPEGASVIAYIGRLIPEKRVDLVLHVFRRLREQQSAMLFIIGDGPERESLIALSENATEVRFLGAMPSLEESASYLYASDVLLNPGCVGLSVNHAFALGLPVVTSQSPGDMRYHGPEGDYLEHGVNAMLSKWNDLDDLVSCVRHVIIERAQFSRAAQEYAHKHLTVQKMVDGLLAAVSFAESLRK